MSTTWMGKLPKSKPPEGKTHTLVALRGANGAHREATGSMSDARATAIWRLACMSDEAFAAQQQPQAEAA